MSCKADQRARAKKPQGARGQALGKYYMKPHNHFPMGKTGYIPGKSK